MNKVFNERSEKDLGRRNGGISPLSAPALRLISPLFAPAWASRQTYRPYLPRLFVLNRRFEGITPLFAPPLQEYRPYSPRHFWPF